MIDAAGTPTWVPITSLIVAGAALFRPDIERLVRGRFSSLSFFPSGRVEIGFSDLGPTIALHGSWTAQHRDQFVHSMRLELTRIRDSATHAFQWLVFRPAKLIPKAEELELAMAFSVSPGEARVLNVLFNDIATKRRFEGELMKVRSLVNDRAKVFNFIPATMTNDQANQVFQSLMQDNDRGLLEAHETLSREFYWDVGSYNLSLYAAIGPKKDSLICKVSFSVTREEAALLKQNTLGILLSAGFVQGIQANFAYPELES
jgi:hypothetical protein